MLRYLGYGRHEADQAVMDLVGECIIQLLGEAQPRCLYREYPLILGPGGAVDGSCFQTISRNLPKNLKDYDQIIVFTATLGTGTDRLIQKYGESQMGKVVIIQAAATAMIEEYCDRVCTGIGEEYESGDRYLWPRFSPGYGDFPLDCQQKPLDNLKAGKRIEIKLMNSLLMMPSRSVTTVMGVSKKSYHYGVKGCGSCEKRDCLYRR